MRLKGKVAVVTGSGAGIGKSIAEVFAQEGAVVVGASRRETNGQPVIDGIVAGGGKGIFVRCDVSREEDVKRLMSRTIDEFGRIDVLVNNAGVLCIKPFLETASEDWDALIDIDLKGTYLCCRYALAHMIKRKQGAIINISSVHAHACLAKNSIYDAAKWGVVGLTKSLAVEFAPDNIRINVVSPGSVETEIAREVIAVSPDKRAFEEWLYSNIPMKRMGRPEEIARACVFLAGDEAGYITGANLYIDGGMTSTLLSREPFEFGAVEVEKGKKSFQGGDGDGK